MQPYKLSTAAENDLRDVARYTLDTWGKKALEQYRKGLKDTFQSIAKDEMPKRVFSTAFPDLLVSKYRYHYIFYLTRNRIKPMIIGIIHEKMDIVSRLNERLN
ncbi:MAG: type II toxin-antitoxin system RelE/ParE family toxin [Desulfuromonas sp.]|nr:type II toxin-antitoxin system RelE/ParE family toxin [Desulfuromonas sp.]